MARSIYREEGLQLAAVVGLACWRPAWSAKREGDRPFRAELVVPRG